MAGSTEFPSKSVTRTASLGQDGNFAVAEEEHVARVLQDRRDIRSNKELAVAEADYYRRSLAHSNDRVRLVAINDRQGKDAAQFA